MNLYIMRHANAGLKRENPLLDDKRSLVKEGKEQCILMARTLNALKVQVDVIVSSPLKRARQTAQLVGTEMGYDAKVEVSPALGLNASYSDFHAAGKICRPRRRADGRPQSQSLAVSGAHDYRQWRRGNPHAQGYSGARGPGPPPADFALAA